MVSSISSRFGQPRLTTNNDSPAGPATPRPAGPGAAATDLVSLSSGGRIMPSGLPAEPPIDRALVDRLGAAIAEGRYPIDPERLAEALFRDHLDFNSGD